MRCRLGRLAGWNSVSWPQVHRTTRTLQARRIGESRERVSAFIAVRASVTLRLPDEYTLSAYPLTSLQILLRRDQPITADGERTLLVRADERGYDPHSQADEATLRKLAITDGS